MANNSGTASYTVCSTVALLLASTFVTAQRAPPRPGEEKELVWTCDAKYNGTSCLRDHLEDAQARSTWPVRGLINASNPFIYFTEGHHSPVMEDIIHFMRHAFLDENVMLHCNCTSPRRPERRNPTIRKSRPLLHLAASCFLHAPTPRSASSRGRGGRGATYPLPP